MAGCVGHAPPVSISRSRCSERRACAPAAAQGYCPNWFERHAAGQPVAARVSAVPVRPRRRRRCGRRRQLKRALHTGRSAACRTVGDSSITGTIPASLGTLTGLYQLCGLAAPRSAQPETDSDVIAHCHCCSRASLTEDCSTTSSSGPCPPPSLTWPRSTQCAQQPPPLCPQSMSSVRRRAHGLHVRDLSGNNLCAGGLCTTYPDFCSSKQVTPTTFPTCPPRRRHQSRTKNVRQDRWPLVEVLHLPVGSKHSATGCVYIGE